MAKGRFLALTGTAFLFASALNMQSAAAGPVATNTTKTSRPQLMNKAASLFKKVDKDKDKKISREGA